MLKVNCLAITLFITKQLALQGFKCPALALPRIIRGLGLAGEIQAPRVDHSPRQTPTPWLPHRFWPRQRNRCPLRKLNFDKLSPGKQRDSTPALPKVPSRARSAFLATCSWHDVVTRNLMRENSQARQLDVAVHLHTRTTKWY